MVVGTALRHGTRRPPVGPDSGRKEAAAASGRKAPPVPRLMVEGCGGAGRRAIPWRQLQGVTALPRASSLARRKQQGGRERPAKGSGEKAASRPPQAAPMKPPASHRADHRKSLATGGAMTPGTRTKRRGGETDALNQAPRPRRDRWLTRTRRRAREHSRGGEAAARANQATRILGEDVRRAPG